MTPEERVKRIAAKKQVASSKMAKDLRVGRPVIVSPAAEAVLRPRKGLKHSGELSDRKSFDDWTDLKRYVNKDEV